MIYFTADLHIGHANIIRLAGRPFPSLGYMELKLAENWNRRVRPNDTIYVLGDFAYRCSRQHAQAILNNLDGHKHLVCGGHDYKLGRRLNGWASVGELTTLRRSDAPPVVLCHYPLLTWWHRRRGAYMLHGHIHTHGAQCIDGKRVNVGVDAWEYAPVSWEEIVEACSP